MMYRLAIDGIGHFSINAHGDEGARILAQSCLCELDPRSRVLLESEVDGRVVVDWTVDEMMVAVGGDATDVA